MQGHPFKFGEKHKLSTLGIEVNSFKIGVLSLESDKYIAVKDNSSVIFFHLLWGKIITVNRMVLDN